LKNIIIISTAFLLLTSCTSLKRYRFAHVKKATSDLVDVSLFSAELKDKKEEKEGKTLWNLKGEGQSQLIKVLGDSLSVKKEDFFEALDKSYLEDDDEPSTLDFTSRNLQMVFSIEKLEDYLTYKPHNDADRIAKIKYEISLPDMYQVTFQKWNKFETEYGDITIGNVETNQNFEAKISPSVSASSKVGTDENNNIGADVGISGEFTAGYSKKETQDVKYRYVKLNGVFNDKKLSMREEGTREIDLAGNVTINTDIKFEISDAYTFKMSKLLDKEDAFNVPANVKMAQIDIRLPDFPNDKDLSVVLHVTYLYRRAKLNARTYPEFDDHVVYYSKEFTKSIPIIKSKDLKPKQWYIEIGGKSLNETDSLAENTITFLSFNEALAFKKWLIGFPCDVAKQDEPIKIGAFSLKTSASAVSKKMITAHPEQVIIKIQ
jgi:hypothetical protein